MLIKKYGLAGTVEQNLPFVIAVLRKNLDEGIGDIVVRKVAENIIRKVKARDRLGEIKAIHDWVKNHVRYTADPYGIELIKSPRRLLMDYAEARKLRPTEPATVLCDCDESSLLAASLLGSVGHDVRIVLMDANPLSREISHAIAQVYASPRGWLFLETTKQRELGWSPSHTREVQIGLSLS